MQIYKDIDPLFLSNALRALITQPDEDRKVNRFELGRWFPNVNVESDKYEFNDKKSLRTFTEAMPFRAPDTEAPIKTRTGDQKKSGQMIPMGEAYIYTETDQMKRAAAAAAGDQSAIDSLDAIFDDLATADRAMRARMEICYAELIRLGTVTIAENGLAPETIDFGRNGTNTHAVTVPWSTVATADPFNEEKVALDVLEDEQDLLPEDLIVVTHRSTYREWAATDAVRNSLQTTRVLDRIDPGDLASIRRDAGLPEVFVYSARAKGYGGSVSQLMPDGDWVYMPRNGALGATQFGTPASAGIAGVDFEPANHPGAVAYMATTPNPPTVYTVFDAIAFPVLYDTNATYRMTV